MTFLLKIKDHIVLLTYFQIPLLSKRIKILVTMKVIFTLKIKKGRRKDMIVRIILL